MRHSVHALILPHSKSFPSFQSQHCESLCRRPWANYLWSLSPVMTPTASAPKQRQASPPKALLVQNKGTLPRIHTVKPVGCKFVSCLALCWFLQGEQAFNSGIHHSPPPDSDMSSEPSHFSLSLESASGGLCISTTYRSSPEWPGLSLSAPESAWG